MKMTKRLQTLALACVAIISLQAQNTILDFQQELKQKNAAIKTIQSEFTENRHSLYLSRELTREGMFYYKKPSLLSISYSNGDYIKFNDNWFENRIGTRRVKSKISTNAVLKNIRQILSMCISGDLKETEKQFKVTLKQEPDAWVVKLLPKGGIKAMGMSEVILKFDRKDMTLSLLKMIDKKHNFTQYHFFDKRINLPLDDDFFLTTDK